MDCNMKEELSIMKFIAQFKCSYLVASDYMFVYGSFKSASEAFLLDQEAFQ